MKLVGSKTSPYVRKVRVILAEKQPAVRVHRGERVDRGHHRAALQPAQQGARRW